MIYIEKEQHTTSGETRTRPGIEKSETENTEKRVIIKHKSHTTSPYTCIITSELYQNNKAISRLARSTRTRARHGECYDLPAYAVPITLAPTMTRCPCTLKLGHRLFLPFTPPAPQSFPFPPIIAAPRFTSASPSSYAWCVTVRLIIAPGARAPVVGRDIVRGIGTPELTLCGGEGGAGESAGRG